MNHDYAHADYISSKWLLECIEEGWVKLDTEADTNRIIHLIRDIAPSADVVEVVRCKDCVYQVKGENESARNICGFRPWYYIPTADDNYCSYGERKDEATSE